MTHDERYENRRAKVAPENGFADDAELEEIRRDADLNASLKRAHRDAKARRGRLVG